MGDAITSYIILFLNLFFGILLIDNKRKYILHLALNPFSVVHRKKFYLLITSMFVHASPDHLVLNILTFYFFAPQLEMAIGSLNFAIIYIASGLLASTPVVLRSRNDPFYYSLGASGAISGVVFSYIYFYPFSRLYIFFFPVGIPALLFALLYLTYCIFAAKYSKGVVNHEAHFWGAISGLAITILLFPQQFAFLVKILF
ncbi:MAG: rhomboid family intramembrane serine protease [Candidatus Kapaibacteriales bacterium]